MSDTQAYKQFGNPVVVNAIETTIRQIISVMDLTDDAHSFEEPRLIALP
ncbi:MAG: hypothetical protein WA131_12165 [Desulfitobacteriaceae bacterium]